MKSWLRHRARVVPLFGLCAAALLTSSVAMANTITQNVSWTIDRAGTTAKYRVAAYGDSIYAGYHGSLSNVAKRAAPWVDSEYASARTRAPDSIRSTCAEPAQRGPRLYWLDAGRGDARCQPGGGFSLA